MTIARKRLIHVESTPYYHITNRCGKISQSDAQFLQQIAYETVSEFRVH